MTPWRVLKTENVELFEQCKKLKKKVTDQADVITTTTSKILLLTVNQTRLENEIHRLQAALKAAQSDREALVNDLEMCHSQISTLNGTNDEFVTKVQDYESQVTRLQLDCKKSVDAQNELNSTIRRLQGQLAAATAVAAPTPKTVGGRDHPTDLGSPKFNGRRTPRPNWGQLEDEGSEGYGLQFEGHLSSQARVEVMWKKIVAQHEQIKGLETDMEQVKAIKSLSIGDVPSSADTNEGDNKEAAKLSRMVTSLLKVGSLGELALLDCTPRDVQRMVDLLYQHFFRALFDANQTEVSFKYLINDRVSNVVAAVLGCKPPTFDVALHSLLFWCLEWESTSPQLKTFLFLYSGQLPIEFLRWTKEDFATLLKACTSMDLPLTGVLAVKDFVDAVATTWPSLTSSDLEIVRSFCKQNDDVVEYTSLGRWHLVSQCLTTFLLQNYFENKIVLEGILNGFGKEQVTLGDHRGHPACGL